VHLDLGFEKVINFEAVMIGQGKPKVHHRLMLLFVYRSNHLSPSFIKKMWLNEGF